MDSARVSLRIVLFVFICLNSLYLIHSHQRCIDWEFQFRFWSRKQKLAVIPSSWKKNRWTFFSTSNLEEKSIRIQTVTSLRAFSRPILNYGGPDHLEFWPCDILFLYFLFFAFQIWGCEESAAVSASPVWVWASFLAYICIPTKTSLRQSYSISLG